MSMPKHYLAIDSNGYPIATITAHSETQAERYAESNLLNHVGCLEVKSTRPAGVMEMLERLYGKAGKDVVEARALAQRRSASLRHYDLPKTEQEALDLRTFISHYAGGEDRGHNFEQKLQESFQAMGLNEKQAKIAAQARMESGRPDSDGERLEGFFKDLGLSEEAARTAANGRE